MLVHAKSSQLMDCVRANAHVHHLAIMYVDYFETYSKLIMCHINYFKCSKTPLLYKGQNLILLFL